MFDWMFRLIDLYRRPDANVVAPPPPRQARDTVICVGCVEDCAMLDNVLAPGEYDISFLDSSEGAYAHIAAAMPSRVIFCMRADDAKSLHVLSMLHLDPRTNRIPILTCIPSILESCGDAEDRANGSGLPLARSGMLTH